MTTDSNRSQVTAAVIAALKAVGELSPSPIPTRSSVKLSVRRAGTPPAELNRAEPSTDSSRHSGGPSRSPQKPAPEAIEAAAESALEAFPEGVRAAARESLRRLQGDFGAAPSQARMMGSGPFSVTPANLPERPSVDMPPFPAAGLDHPAVRAAWTDAHHAIADGLFRLQPAVLLAYAEVQLDRERWEAGLRGRKPSGDLRHPVPRDRLDEIMLELKLKHEAEIKSAASTIHAIETGDVVDIEYFNPDFDEEDSYTADGVPMLVLQSDLDRRKARQAKANRKRTGIEADEAKWDALYEELLADLPPSDPEPVIPNLPDLPSDREPTASEIAAFSNAIERHLNYLKRGEQIEAKRKADAATKLRTAARREAEEADPKGVASAKRTVKLKKASERQRRWRERRRADKNREG